MCGESYKIFGGNSKNSKKLKKKNEVGMLYDMKMLGGREILGFSENYGNFWGEKITKNEGERKLSQPGAGGIREKCTKFGKTSKFLAENGKKKEAEND